METRQAGESLACDCGAQVAVPTLRQLRQLPEADGAAAEVAGPVWSARQGAISVCLLLAAASLVATAASRLTEQPVPTIDAAKYTKSVDQRISNLTPLEAWQRWVDTYQPLATTGFEIYRHPASVAIQLNLDWHRWIQWSGLGLTALFGVAALVLGLAGGKPSRV